MIQTLERHAPRAVAGCARSTSAVLVVSLAMGGCGGVTRTHGGHSATRAQADPLAVYVRKVDAICADSALTLVHAFSAQTDTQAAAAVELGAVVQTIDHDIKLIAALPAPREIAGRVRSAIASMRQARQVFTQAQQLARSTPASNPITDNSPVVRLAMQADDIESTAAVSWAVAGIETTCAPAA